MPIRPTARACWPPSSEVDRVTAEAQPLNPAFRKHVVEFLRTLYPDFGPTLTSGKLREHYGAAVSVEMLWKWMTDAGLALAWRTDDDHSSHDIDGNAWESSS